MIKNFEYFFDIVHAYKVKRKLVLAAAEDENALKSVKVAYEEGIIEPILVGNKQQIKEIADKIHVLEYQYFPEVIERLLEV